MVPRAQQGGVFEPQFIRSWKVSSCLIKWASNRIDNCCKMSHTNCSFPACIDCWRDHIVPHQSPCLRLREGMQVFLDIFTFSLRIIKLILRRTHYGSDSVSLPVSCMHLILQWLFMMMGHQREDETVPVPVGRSLNFWPSILNINSINQIMPPIQDLYFAWAARWGVMQQSTKACLVASLQHRRIGRCVNF